MSAKNSQESIKIGIVGLGVVGSGTFNILTKNNEELARRLGHPIEVIHVGARRDNPAADTSNIQVSRDIMNVVNDPQVQILIELIGGTTLAKQITESAIKQGKHVVTANKALIAEHGNELFALAKEHSVSIAFEAGVAGGIPVIKAIREGLSANKIEWLAGIINGTGNFILTEMKDKGRDFSDVLAEAQKLGYAEADPTFDVEGIDAAHKLTILASLAFGVPLQFEKAYTEGITRIGVEDVNYAEDLGYYIKHLGVAKKTDKGIELRVHPTLIPKTRLIANVNGVMNAVVVHGHAVGSTLYYGPGAGSYPTASAVVADVMDVSRNILNNSSGVPHFAFDQDKLCNSPILDIEAIQSAYYLRLSVEDKAGVLAQITNIFSDSNISIKAVQQPEASSESTHVPLIILTQVVNEGDLNEALLAIEKLDAVSNDIMRIRVESLK